MTQALRALEMTTRGCTGIDVEILLYYEGRWTQLLLWINNKLHSRVPVYEVYFMTQERIHRFGGKTEGKEPPGRFRCWRKDNIRAVFTKIEWEGKTAERVLNLYGANVKIKLRVLPVHKGDR
jgi:hypothetical protein